MVIQRSWKGSDSESNPGKVSTASVANTITSSDDSNGSIETQTDPPNSNFKKSTSTLQMAENVLFRLKQRLGWQGPNPSSEAVMRPFELLRINVQAAFDKEVDTIVQKFMENYFKPAFKNIKENIGDQITDDLLQKMTCALLENCKTQYTVQRTKPTCVSSAASSAEVISQNRSALKRPEQNLIESVDQSKRICNVAVQDLSAIHNTTHSKSSTLITAPQPRRQIFWNTANISSGTNFVLDVQANQAFGFGTDGKERLASKHPELIRYLPDEQDRNWLIEQNVISAKNRNSRFLFLIYDEVYRLYNSSEFYKNRPNINLSIMHQFKVPNFMIQKMKLFFVDLNIKSRGLIANSYSAVNSHLRNALLQGSQVTSGLPPSNNSSAVSTSTDSASLKLENINQQKFKSSSLSSSHATLTALLTNSTTTTSSIVESISINNNVTLASGSNTTNVKNVLTH